MEMIAVRMNSAYPRVLVPGIHGRVAHTPSMDGFDRANYHPWAMVDDPDECYKKHECNTGFHR